MSDYFVAHPMIGAPGPVTRTDSTPQWPIGMEVLGLDRNASTSAGGAAGVFVYCRGSNVASAGAFCHIQNGSAVMLADANSTYAWPIGVAAGLLSATNVYGWVQIQGRCDFARGTNTVPASNVPYHFAATAGHVASNVAAGKEIFGVCGVPGQTNTASASAGYYQFDLYRPHAVHST